MNMGIRILIGIIVAAIGAAGFYALNNNDIETPANINNAASQEETSQRLEEENDSPEVLTLEEAIEKIGMECQSTGATESSCTWKSDEYTLVEPADWMNDAKLRAQACEQGYINANYQILSNGNSFYFTTDLNEDLKPLSKSMKNAGVEAEITAYCG